MTNNRTPPRETIASLRRRAQAGELNDHELERLAEDPRAGVQSLVRQHQRRQRAADDESLRLQQMHEHESVLWNHGALRVAGVDEVGAGPLAGPVVAAAVILHPGTQVSGTALAGINDSKQVPPAERERLAREIRNHAAAFAFGSCSPQEIDTLNILRASCEAMRRAVVALPVAPDHLLVDAHHIEGTEIPQTPLRKGDERSVTIAAASILAKVERDAIMDVMAQRYPGYGFERHRGYGTPEHLNALERQGPSPIHRHSFSPVAAATAAPVRNRRP